MRRKRCRCCRKLYQPHPQTYRQQKTCDQPACRAWRLRRKWKSWSQRNPLYAQSRKLKLKAWSRNHSEYWRKWRKKHPAYAARNRKLQKARDARKLGFLAKPTAWRSFWLQNLDELREIKNLQDLAKPTEWERALASQIDGVLSYLRSRVLLAKPTDIDRRRSNISQ